MKPIHLLASVAAVAHVQAQHSFTATNGTQDAASLLCTALRRLNVTMSVQVRCVASVNECSRVQHQQQQKEKQPNATIFLKCLDDKIAAKQPRRTPQSDKSRDQAARHGQPTPGKDKAAAEDKLLFHQWANAQYGAMAAAGLAALHEAWCPGGACPATVPWRASAASPSQGRFGNFAPGRPRYTGQRGWGGQMPPKGEEGKLRENHQGEAHDNDKTEKPPKQDLMPHGGHGKESSAPNIDRHHTIPSNGRHLKEPSAPEIDWNDPVLPKGGHGKEPSAPEIGWNNPVLPEQGHGKQPSAPNIDWHHTVPPNGRPLTEPSAPEIDWNNPVLPKEGHGKQPSAPTTDWHYTPPNGRHLKEPSAPGMDGSYPTLPNGGHGKDSRAPEIGWINGGRGSNSHLNTHVGAGGGQHGIGFENRSGGRGMPTSNTHDYRTTHQGWHGTGYGGMGRHDSRGSHIPAGGRGAAARFGAGRSTRTGMRRGRSPRNVDDEADDVESDGVSWDEAD